MTARNRKRLLIAGLAGLLTAIGGAGVDLERHFRFHILGQERFCFPDGCVYEEIRLLKHQASADAAAIPAPSGS